MRARVRGLLSTRHEYRVLGLMLASVHATVWWDPGGAVSSSLVLAHLGLFLIWQPIWSRELRLSWGGALVFVLAMVIFVAWLNRWLVSFWLLLLIGLVGGRITVGRVERYAYLMALLFLVSDLLLGSIPRVFAVETLGPEVTTPFGYGLLLVALALILLPGEKRSPGHGYTVDFLYGLTMSMLTAILGMGTLISMYATGLPYAVALCQTVLVIALFLLAISWLWAPFAGVSGFGRIWERYLLNIGTPVEGWLAQLEDAAQNARLPQDFLRTAMTQLLELPWVAGVSWWAAETGTLGVATSHTLNITSGRLHTTIHAHRPIGPALLLHGRLLINLIGHFHRAKEREQELAQRAHMQAVYETGARITHDIKNLLQSLHTMTLAVQNEDDSARDDGLERLLRRQLPHLTQRLQLALDKLQAPRESKATRCRLTEWWEALKARNDTQAIRFESRITSDPLIPAELFDSVADNLLENARLKRQSEPFLNIEVKLISEGNRITLRVSDDGAPVDPDVRDNLFRAPVKSRSGLGIGLYQAARQAQQMGYVLSLRESERGQVCFELHNN
ncbi:MAG: HAMP domain-containing histidine kinase [Gammaproteobacteria bacterium]|nr:HAMP domain-containing histidine kinase [Gammaproteobacteria bacterium]NIR81888.1 HAMP domain-containing histidine kinase [Gammaproteobacteria bacterium]NIR88720.1 HAMP domain-containing histidine kinase [Gammaproteobacteria bacterium]NIU02996.1 HAMP domain-containing histidine kinase [Gammaproteobacteria bacterium]NIV50517.1 sensor histidine kinase [Gammaproteobacteria bacterium]